MRKKYLFLSGLFILLIALIFLFSGCEFIQDFLGGGGGGESPNDEDYITANATHLLTNWDFDDPDYYDANYTYDVGDTVYDKIPNWILGVQQTSNSSGYQMEYLLHPQAFDTGANNIFVEMYDSYNGSEGHAMWMFQDLPGIPIKASTRIRIKFKILNYSGGNPVYPYYEAPIKVFLTVNGSNSYLIILKSPKGTGSTQNIQDTYADTNTWITLDANLVGLTNIAGGDVIYEGDEIDQIKVQAQGWNWDVYIDYVDIYEE